MLNRANLPKLFGGEAVYCAVYLLNRTPTASWSQNVTPPGLYYSKKPNIKNFKVFGCVASRLVNEKSLDKTDSRSKICTFVGYCNSGYRLWSINDRKIKLSRNVSFQEPKFYHVNFKNNCNPIIYNFYKSEDEKKEENSKEPEP